MGSEARVYGLLVAIDAWGEARAAVECWDAALIAAATDADWCVGIGDALDGAECGTAGDCVPSASCALVREPRG